MSIITDKKTLKLISKDVLAGISVKHTIRDMYNELSKCDGVGIAAIQIGVPTRIFIINTSRCKMVIVNPVLSEGKYPKKSKEGCLSVPGKRVTIDRFNHIVISGYDENWQPITKKLKGISAFVAQHEMDHLNGVTI